MSVNHHLAHASLELVKAMDKMSDESLPKEISDVVKLHAKLAVGSSLKYYLELDIKKNISRFLYIYNKSVNLHSYYTSWLT